MNIRTLARILGVLVVLGIAWGIWRIVAQWSYQQIGPYAVRRSVLTGKLQVRGDDGQWTDSLKHDPYAPSLTPDDLKQAQLTAGAWGANGVLCGRARNRSQNHAIQGRIAFRIEIHTFDGKRFKDRTLRETVDWPPGAATPFVLNTGLPTPTATQRWTVDLVPVQAAGDAGGGD